MRLLIHCLAMAVILLAVFTNPGASLYLQCSDCDYAACYEGDDCQEWDCIEDAVWGPNFEYCTECDATMNVCDTRDCGEWEPPDYMFVDCEFT